jgi:hypothetical protein
VQIDETKTNHNVKSHRDRVPVRRPGCAITMVDISTAPAKWWYAEVIPDISTATMKPIIEKVVRQEHIYKQINGKPMIFR